MTAPGGLPGGPPAGVERAVLAAFRLAVRCAYPRSFRDRFGREMAAWFLRGFRSAPPGGSARSAYVVRALGDAFRTGVRWRLRPVARGLDGTRIDATIAVRRIRRNPLVTATVIVTLALPMAVNSAVFGAVDAALLRPLPYPDPDRLVSVWVSRGHGGPDRVRLSGPELSLLWRESGSFEALGGIWSRHGTLGGEPGPEHVEVGYVTRGFFEVLGAAPHLGRLVRDSDDVEGRYDVVLLSHRLWTARYRADPDVVGRTVEFNGTPVTVVGVLPRGFRVRLPPEARLAETLDVFLPWGGGYAEMPAEWRFFAAVGRRAPGVGPDDLREELAGLAPVPEAGEDPGPELRFLIRSLHAGVTDHLRPGVLAALASALLLLLVACANVSSLLLARLSRRDGELAIRTALGAGRGRLVKQVALEHALLFVAAGTLGVVLAPAVLAAVARVSPAGPELIRVPTLDLRVLWATFLCVLVAGVVFGVLPALGLGRDARWRGSSAGERSAPGRRLSARGTLVAAETGLCVMLLVGSGLLFRSLENLRATETGFRAEQVVAGRLSLPSAEYPYSRPERISGFYEELVDRLREAPGVDEAGLTEQLPLVAGSDDAEPYERVGRRGEAEPGPTLAHTRPVSRGYFRAVGAELLQGRWFQDSDSLGAGLVVIVDDRLAAGTWPGESAVGKRIGIPLFLNGTTSRRWARVVGVVRHLQLTPLRRPGPPQIWLHHLQSPRRSSSLVVRGSGGAGELAATLRDAVASLDPTRPLYEVQTLRALLDRSLAPDRFLLGLTSAFALLAVLLAAMGLYAVTAHAVSDARREIGIRLALGAGPGTASRGVLLRAAGHVVVGMVVGLAGAVGLAGSLGSTLVGVGPGDPVALAAAVGIMSMAAAGGAAGPLVRASRTEPARALAAD